MAKRISDNGKTTSKADAAARSGGPALAAGLQRFWRDLSLIAIAPALADRVSIAATPKVRAAAQGQALMSRVELGVK